MTNNKGLSPTYVINKHAYQKTGPRLPRKIPTLDNSPTSICPPLEQSNDLAYMNEYLLHELIPSKTTFTAHHHLNQYSQ